MNKVEEAANKLRGWKENKVFNEAKGIDFPNMEKATAAVLKITKFSTANKININTFSLKKQPKGNTYSLTFSFDNKGNKTSQIADFMSEL